MEKKAVVSPDTTIPVAKRPKTADKEKTAETDKSAADSLDNDATGRLASAAKR